MKIFSPLILTLVLSLQGEAKSEGSNRPPSDGSIWIQVVDPELDFVKEEKRPIELGIKLQRASFAQTQDLPFPQPLYLAGFYYQNSFWQSEYRYQVTAWLGESPIESVQNRQFLGRASSLSRFFGIEAGVETNVWSFGRLTLAPSVAVRTQFVSQRFRSSQLPVREGSLILPLMSLQANYLITASIGGEFILAHDSFFYTQYQIGLFRRW